MNIINDKGTVTCPNCEKKTTMDIPNDRCIPFYKCDGCGNIISPKGEDCCVFCSYGDRKCPVGDKG